MSHVSAKNMPIRTQSVSKDDCRLCYLAGIYSGESVEGGAWRGGGWGGGGAEVYASAESAPITLIKF